ncbi:MAG: hypothetical protein IPL79_12245 [Myxococcales bacterium]|nr:hypothetical protein [Myxococcales bacterium]
MNEFGHGVFASHAAALHRAVVALHASPSPQPVSPQPATQIAAGEQAHATSAQMLPVPTGSQMASPSQLLLTFSHAPQPIDSPGTKHAD